MIEIVLMAMKIFIGNQTEEHPPRYKQENALSWAFDESNQQGQPQIKLGQVCVVFPKSSGHSRLVMLCWAF